MTKSGGHIVLLSHSCEESLFYKEGPFRSGRLAFQDNLEVFAGERVLDFQSLFLAGEL